MGLMTEKTGELVSIWGQANVQNELDAVARVVSSAQEVPFPLEALLAFPRIAWVLCTQTCRHAIHSRRKATSGVEDQLLRYLRAWHMHG